MKAGIIGAGSEALHTIEKAKALGVTVAAFDGNPDAEGLGAADSAVVVDISNEKATLEAVRKEQPDFILTAPIGRYLTTVGAVNDTLGLPGISKESAVLCTDKYAFHQALAKEGLRPCPCYLLGERLPDISQLKLSYPAVLKPRYGSGSREVHVINGEKELAAALDAPLGEDYILEECVPGTEYGVDGAVTEAGFQLILLRRKINTPPPARQAVGYFSVLPEKEKALYQTIFNYLTKVSEIIGLRECLFHGDIIMNGDKPFVIELSARPSGHNLHNLFTPLAAGVDMAEEYIRCRLGLPFDFCPLETKKMMIHYFDMEGTIKQVPEREALEALLGQRFLAWQCSLRPGELLAPATNGHSLMGRGFFILEGSSEENLNRQAQLIKSFFMQP